MVPKEYSLSSTETKLAFLEKVLQTNSNLQDEFVAFFREGSKPPARSMEDPQSFIAEVTEELKNALEGLNLSDTDWENYVPRHAGYIPEYEAIDNMNQEQVEELMEGYYDAMESHCVGKEFDKAFLMAAGCYDACKSAEIEDEYSSLGDTTVFLLDTLQTLMTKLNNLFSMVNIPDNQYFTLFEALCIHNKNLYADNDDFLRFFEPLLINMLTSDTKASIAENEIKKQGVSRLAAPRFAAEIDKMLHGDKAWEDTALKFFKEDKHLADNLLHSYAEKDHTAFVKIAFELWQNDKFKSEFAVFYFETLLPGDNILFYKEVALYLLDSMHDIKYYKAVRNLLSLKERNELLENNAWNKMLFIQILNVENRFEEALDFIEANADEYNLEKLIRPFVRDYPSRSFRIISNTIHQTLATRRGRNVYERIAGILKLASTISQKETETRQLIHDLFNRRPALPALRNELRSAGLWRN